MMTPQSASSLLSYLRLMRIPNLFTSFANIVMGFVFVSRELTPLPAFLVLLASSSCLYLAGMILNDVFDVDIDRVERPARPIPSGAISLPKAARLGGGLIVVGVALGWIAGWFFSADGVPAWRTGLIATLLAACVLLYDGYLKKTPFGAVAMGGCRTLNILLGMSLFSAVGAPIRLGMGAPQWCVAGGVGVYIAGLTWFARTEARESNRGLLGLGLTVMVAGIALLALFPKFGIATFFKNEVVWTFLLILVMFSVFRRCVMAIITPSPANVQAAVKMCLFSLITLDAAVCLAVAGPWYAIGVLALLLPTLALGKIVYAT